MKRCSFQFRRRISIILVLFIMISCLFIGTEYRSEAATGSWRKDSKGYWYSYSNGSYAKYEWVKWNGKWYFFGASGYMRTGWQTIGGKNYYLGTDGAMRTGWKKIGNKWYYFGTDGAMRTGWQTISGKDYFFSKDGYMLVGTYKLSGETYKFNSDGVRISGEKSYCFYKSLMDDIRAAIKRNDYSYGYTSGGDKVKYKHLSETLRKKWGGGRYGTKYAFADLNSDGIKEMIVYDAGKVASIYTYYKGKAKLLREFDSDSPGCERAYMVGKEYDVYLTKKGEIVFNYAYVPQGIDVGVVVCRVKDGKLVLVSGYSEGEGYGYYPVKKMASPQVQVDYDRTISQTEVNAIKKKKSEAGLSVAKHSF